MAALQKRKNKITIYYFYYALLFFILSLRILLIHVASFQIDAADWQAWANRLVLVGPTHFYAANYFADYFPGYLYILWFLGLIFQSTTSLFTGLSTQFITLLKLVTTFFELGTAFYIYKIVKHYNKPWSFIAVIFYLGNVALIFNSSVWGQVDAVPTFFLILAAYKLFEQKQLYVYSVTAGLAALIKPQSLIAMPVFLLYQLKTFKLKQNTKALLLIALLPPLLAYPFFMNDPLFGLGHLFLQSASVYPYTSLYALNLWAIIGWWQPDATTHFLFTNQIWGYLFYLIAIAAILIPFVKKRLNTPSIYLTTALMIMAFFLFPTRVHERYLFPFFAFLLITACIKKSKLLLAIYGITALIHFINLWYVYFYYNTVYNNPAFTGSMFFSLIDQYYKIVTILLLLSFGILLYTHYQIAHETSSHDNLS